MARTDPMGDSDRQSSLPAQPHPTGEPRMGRRAADLAAVCWAGFLAASAASLLAFAVIDPGRLGEASELIDQIDRMAGYGLGFLYLWIVGMVAGGLSVLLVRSARRDARERDSRGRRMGE